MMKRSKGKARQLSRRSATLQQLVAGSYLPAGTQVVISREFDEAEQVSRVQPDPRRWLLQVVHSCRALDTFLKEIVVFHKCPGKRTGINQYLDALKDHGANSGKRKLPLHSAERYKASIGKVRNRYLHEAGAIPATYAEVKALQGEMHQCLQDANNL